MAFNPTQLSWPQVQTNLSSTSSILLGNGFSISCDLAFKYNNLVALAKSDFKLSAEAEEIFNGLDTTNFEEVLRDMESACQIATMYGCSTPCKAVQSIKDDVANTKNALIGAITKVHGSYPDRFSLSDTQKDNCGKFLSQFKFIYTLNYDFLLYWVWLHEFEKGNFKGGDGFNYYQYFDGLPAAGGFRFLHGALHLYTSSGFTCKHKSTQGKETLLKRVTEGLLVNQYPLFVAEGTSLKKMKGIKSNDYLRACFDEFSQVSSDLVVFGCALGATDKHFVDAISKNQQLVNLYVANYGNVLDPGLYATLKGIDHVRQGNKQPLNIYWFDSSGVNPWL